MEYFYLLLELVSSCNLSRGLFLFRVCYYFPFSALPYMEKKLTVVIVIEVENPKLVLIMGCVGLTLNIISAVFLHGKYLTFPSKHTY